LGQERAICPEGKVSTSWCSYIQELYGYAIVKVRFAQKDCAACPSLDMWVRSPAGQSRSIVLPARPLHEALQQTRSDLTAEEGKEIPNGAWISVTLGTSYDLPPTVTSGQRNMAEAFGEWGL
jgi:hypothetical protein